MSKGLAAAWHKRTPKPDPNQGSTTIGFMCGKFVSYPLPLTMIIWGSPYYLHLFTSYKVEKSIQCLQHEWLSDHRGLQDQHLIYELSTVSAILARMLSRALVECHPNTWTMYKIVPIHNLEEPLQAGNYENIMIDHTQDKIVWHGGWHRTQGLQSGGQRDTNPLPCGISKSLLYHQAHPYIILFGE